MDMIPKECKRLAEVDFPIAVVSKHAAREKKFPVPRGLPSTMHQWWARRPLASCRAMLMALLLPDPCDSHCPKEFKEKAAKILLNVPLWDNKRRQAQVKSDEGLRRALLDFIAEIANWDVANDLRWITPARELVKAAYPEEPPLVVDPFAGGGSIPLEALRLGCEAFASDLNPVACLILKVMLEDIPRWGREKVKVKSKKGEIEADGLAEALRIAGKEIKEEAERELADLYPKDPDGATPIAYLWARSVRCESPNCGAEIPLVRSFWLCKKSNRKRALRYRVKRQKEKGKSGKVAAPELEFEIFEPKSDKEVPDGTVTRARATCLCCGTVLPPERVRAQLAAQRGGADVVFDERGRRTGGARMLAVVTLKPGEQGRHYRLPTERDYEAVRRAQERLKAILDEWERKEGNKEGNKEGKRKKEKGKSAEHLHIRDTGNFLPFNFSLLPSLPPLCPVPDELAPTKDAHRAVGSQIPLYGMTKFGDLFTARQKVALVTLAEKISGLYRKGDATSMATAELLAMAMDKVADFNCSLSAWRSSNEDVGHLFGRHALPIVWDFVETNLCCSSYVDFGRAVGHVLDVVNHTASAVKRSGQVQISDARKPMLPEESAHILFTDPPYYDAVPYSDLSDFFFVWLKRALPGHPLLRDPFNPANPLTPKVAEIVQDETKTVDSRAKDRQFFEDSMAKAFAEGRRLLRQDGVGSVVFAHKTTEGWEALLNGMIRGGWTITGSWPIATEMASRLNARETASLATSVHLVCRPRPDDAPVGDWGEVLRELPKRVGDWMERLQGEGIRGADLVFACIGPALEIFSRYRRVETAEGREVKLAEYLKKVWEVVGRTALEQVLGTAEARARNGAAGAIEEDARLTALFLWTLQATNGNGEGKSEKEKGKNQESEEEAENINDDEQDINDDEQETPMGKTQGYSLAFDVVRRFAQPLGIDLPKWEGRIIETKKGVVRLMAVSERAKQIFGSAGIESAVEDLLAPLPSGQMVLPGLEEEVSQKKLRTKGRRTKVIIGDPREMNISATTLDRVHAAMLLQASGQANALRELIKAEQQRGAYFLRLANALSALYPTGSEEKRLLDAMLLAVPR